MAAAMLNTINASFKQKTQNNHTIYKQITALLTLLAEDLNKLFNLLNDQTLQIQCTMQSEILIISQLQITNPVSLQHLCNVCRGVAEMFLKKHLSIFKW
ncbi:predicted protein [Uncinocarpus reesii 1704]|uniref:Uncharacterized protein n=1 Tax=Uncinocarpus reesii (strain UAMH 1704) TaxID=336963 RepID=C4JPU4_UNCRE|nr:uncharacterized protein UREG_04587 [Uncinocarpus reesii 1704]EEP79741.1 predicted protein [Uncinocarpus reesii 1704]